MPGKAICLAFILVLFTAGCKKEPPKPVSKEPVQTEIADKFAKALRNTIRITPRRTSMDNIPIGGSRFAGVPDVPKGFIWPKYHGKPLTHLAQIRLSDVAPFDIEKKLPKTGWLYFFFEETDPKWGFDPKDRGAFRVLYYNVPPARLVRAKLPGQLSGGEAGYKPCLLEFKGGKELPYAGDERFDALGIDANEAKEIKAYEEILSKKLGYNPQDSGYHHLLGYPQAIQNDMRLECQLVTNGLYCGDSSGYNDPRADRLLGGAKDWNLLLQIDTDEERGPGWMWGDVGRLYFWIRDQDLASRKFDAAWMVLQCY